MNDPAIHNPDGRQLALHFNVISNEFDNEDRFYAELILSNKSSQTLHRNWSIYFNFVRKIFPETVPKEFIVTHINGDFFSLSPTKEFKCLKPKEKVRIDFIANFWAIKKNDAPKGFYIVYREEDGEELQPQNIE